MTLKMHSVDKVEENIKKIGALFPNALTETLDENGNDVLAIDFDILKQELSPVIVEGREERYQFTWPDKMKSILLANAPIAKTLRPCREESVNFDHTENIYIEGDNLDVLKLLQETYLGKIKMIYIDPPYNTGNDLIYEDNFVQNSNEYLANSGQYDKDGNRLVQNTESNGRFHTDWLNMIYPRIKLAKDLLTDDGVIFISIDDGEIDNLKKVCDEVFSPLNYVNTISVKMKNIAGASGGGEDRRLKKNLEYILVYAKQYNSMHMNNVYEYTEIYDLVCKYRESGVSWKYTTALVDPGKKEYLGSTVDGAGDEIKIYKRVNPEIKSISQIIKDEGITEQEAYYKYGTRLFQTAMPQSSIRPRVMKKLKELGVNPELVSIEYIPRSGKNKGRIYEQFYKGNQCRLFAWLKDVTEEIDGILYKKDLQGTYWDFVGETKNLTKEGGVCFPNGKKPLALLKRIVQMQVNKDELVLDFFSGSATTAHAVMQLNAEDGGNRKFIMVQLPEKLDEKSEAFKDGFTNISEIGKERIRRAGEKIIQSTNHSDLGLDIGFRVLKLDSTNMKEVYYKPDEIEQSILDSFANNIKEDRTQEDLLFQVMLDLGVLLSSKIEITTISGKKVFNVADNFLIACFDEDVTDEVVKAIAQKQPYYVVFRESSIASDAVATNFELIFATYSPTTVREVL